MLRGLSLIRGRFCRRNFFPRTSSSGTLTTNHNNTMQTENDTSKPENEPEQEAGEGCSGATCSASFPAMPLDAALEFADNGGSTGGIMTHEALKALAKSVREISTAAREVAARLADELEIKPTVNRHMAERAIERLNNSLPNATTQTPT